MNCKVLKPLEIQAGARDWHRLRVSESEYLTGSLWHVTDNGKQIVNGELLGRGKWVKSTS